jgi:hypothetical protein
MNYNYPNSSFSPRFQKTKKKEKKKKKEIHITGKTEIERKK